LRLGDPFAIEIAVFPVADEPAVSRARLRRIALLFVDAAEEVEAADVLDRREDVLGSAVGNPSEPGQRLGRLAELGQRDRFDAIIAPFTLAVPNALN